MSEGVLFFKPQITLKMHKGLSFKKNDAFSFPIAFLPTNISLPVSTILWFPKTLASPELLEGDSSSSELRFLGFLGNIIPKNYNTGNMIWSIPRDLVLIEFLRQSTTSYAWALISTKP